MTSAHGNKTLGAAAGVCFTAVALLMGGLVSEKRTKIRFFEKKYSKALSALEINNQKAVSKGSEISEFSDK